MDGGELKGILEQGKGFALFRMPGSKQINLIVGSWKKEPIHQQILEKASFLFVPFHATQEHAWILPGPADEKNQAFGSFGIPKGLPELNPWLPKGVPDSQSTTQKESEYLALTGHAIRAIEKGTFNKVVTARKVVKAIRVDPWKGYSNLLFAYPNAFVFLILIPGETCWIGASPELLGSIGKSGWFETRSLAGTREKGNRDGWEKKELEEQAWVSRYIEKTLLEFQCGNLKVTGPESLELGSLVHLQTRFQCKFSDTKNTFKLLLKLHPTPAVSGEPQGPALEFIKKEEGFDRGLYAGFLGPAFGSGSASQFVNLRSANLFKDQVEFFAGAGIVRGSVPEKELKETELKINSIASHLE